MFIHNWRLGIQPKIGNRSVEIYAMGNKLLRRKYGAEQDMIKKERKCKKKQLAFQRGVL